MKLAAVLLAAAFLIAACSDGDAPEAEEGPSATATVANASVNPNSGLQDGLADFDITALTWNAYWYSRYNLGSLAMMSGLGVTFAPPMEAVQAMVGMVDQGPESGEHVSVPQNPALLTAVFAGGNPQFVNAFNGEPGDFTNWRWDPEGLDARLTPSAQAQTIMKEVEWSKFFNANIWAGDVTDEFGAMDRFKGLVLFTEAKMQAAYALANLRNDDGLFVAASRVEDGTVTVDDSAVRPSDQYQMLQAISDVRMVLQSPETYNGVYADAEALQQLGSAADELFSTIVTLEPSTVEELSLAAQTFTWFAATTEDASLQTQALEALREAGDALIAAERLGVLDRAVAIRGLIEAGRILDDAEFLSAAAEDFAALAAAYDEGTGSFDGVTSLTTWQVGDLLGALNTLRLNASGAVERDDVDRMFIGVFEAIVNRGGMMQAVIPKEMEASPFEQTAVTQDLFFAYPGIPTPDAAGGPNGTAAVDAAEMTFDGSTGRWTVSDPRFSTAGAMHSSNEMFWTFGMISGFPAVTELDGSATSR